MKREIVRTLFAVVSTVAASAPLPGAQAVTAAPEVPHMTREQATAYVAANRLALTAGNLVGPILSGDAIAVEALLSAGVDVNDESDLPKSAMRLATSACADEDVDMATRLVVIDVLLAHGARVNEPEGSQLTPLINAAQHCPAAVVHKLVDAGADWKYRSPLGHTALSTAFLLGNYDAAEALLDAGARLSADQAAKYAGKKDTRLQGLLQRSQSKSTPRPAPPPAAALPATVVVDCDAPCSVSVDSAVMGRAVPERPLRVRVTLGDHQLVASAHVEDADITVESHQRVTAATAGEQTVAVTLAAELQAKLATRPPWADPKTGLLWAPEDNGKDVTLVDAGRYCDALTTGGFSDWRLPTIEELQGIFDESVNWMTRHHIRGPLTLTNYFAWSTSRDGEKSLTFDFSAGGPYATRAVSSGGRRALCVRSPQG